jgi:hypothetical protein
MITTQSNHSRKCLPRFRRALFARISGWVAIENAVVAVFNLLNRVGIVIAYNGYQRSEYDACPHQLTKSQEYLRNPQQWPSYGTDSLGEEHCIPR